MESTAILKIMQGVDALDADPAAKQKFRHLVRTIGVAYGFAWVEREDRVAFASALLARKVSRPTIRDRLIATYGVSRPQAYRIIGTALQLSQNRAANETTSVFNGSMD